MANRRFAVLVLGLAGALGSACGSADLEGTGIRGGAGGSVGAAGSGSGAGTGIGTDAATTPGLDGAGAANVDDAANHDGAADSRVADIGLPEAPAFDSGVTRWVPHFTGSGRMTDVVTGNPIDLPMDRRVHVAIVPEGYLQADLDAVFDSDVEAWMTEVFSIEPYSVYKDAFVVWKIRLASNARVAPSDPQTADTAFQLGITADGSGVGNLGAMTAARIWDALRDFPIAMTSYGAGSRGARNVVAYMHVLDPARGRAGLSGRTTSVVNPSNSAQRISLAIALGRAHEFTHAFSRVADEYIETTSTNTPPANTTTNTSAGVTNVVASPTCSTLPWRHLLVGTAINPSTDQLVGAFGTPAQGYHSELKCLMNGTHDNATVFGGNGNLRSNDRMCNFCREIAAFRLYERTSVVADTTTSLDIWATTYRTPFYGKFGFEVPSPVPQQSSDSTPWWMPCTP